MAREYCDLLALPISGRGVDTPARLAMVASRLGYAHLGLYRYQGRISGTPGLEVLSVMDHGTRDARRADLRIARGRRSRGAVSSDNIDFIIPDPRDRVTIRFAGENDVPLAYAYSDLLMERSIRRSNLLRRWNLVHREATKHGCRELLVSGTGNSYLLRDPRDLASLLVSALGLSTEEALDWVSSTPCQVLKRANGRG